MDATEISIRAPTGRAWLMTTVGIIVSAELFYEMRDRQTSRFFGVLLDRSEVYAVAAAIAVIAILSAIYLISLYAKPGNLTIQSTGLTRRHRKGLWSWHSTRAPLNQWHVHITYFSTADQHRGVFKRLQLNGPGIVEVILFTDLRDGTELIHAVERLSDGFGTYAVDVESADPSVDEPASTAR